MKLACLRRVNALSVFSFSAQLCLFCSEVVMLKGFFVMFVFLKAYTLNLKHNENYILIIACYGEMGDSLGSFSFCMCMQVVCVHVLSGMQPTLGTQS